MPRLEGPHVTQGLIRAPGALVKAELGNDAKERDCVTDWLSGQQLSGIDAVCWCWESDPFPAGDYPDKLPKRKGVTSTTFTSLASWV